VRDDSGIYEGWEVPVHYDSLLSKLVTFGADREQARRRMRRALREYVVLGVKTTVAFLGRVMDHPDFVRGDLDTGFIERFLSEGPPADERAEVAAVAAAIAAFRERSAARLSPAGSSGSSWRSEAWRDGLRGRL
jgi:acetyl-CoA carboxylase biotin carboxylase subunit